MLKIISIVAVCEVTQILVFTAIICINLYVVVFNNDVDLVRGTCIVLIICQNLYSAIDRDRAKGMAL